MLREKGKKVGLFGAAIVATTLISIGGAAEPIAQAADVLECAFQNRFGHELAEILDVRTKVAGKTVRRFRLQMATAVVNDRTRTLILFLAPAGERGTKLLTIENSERRNEHFLFMPFMGRVRRIYGGRKNEAFLGTQFSQEDLERLDVSELEIHSDRIEWVGSEAVRAIGTSQRGGSGYSRTEYLVADADCCIIEIRHFKAGWPGPAKVISTPRSRMVSVKGVSLPGWAVAKDLESGRETEVLFSAIEISPDISPRIFEPSALERLVGIPGLPRSTSMETKW